MEVISHPSEMSAWSRERHREGLRIGLVPTMGSLHEGHLSLVRKAESYSDVRVVSIFVNPTQFGPGEDYDAYPRDDEHDLAACRGGGNIDIVFMPPADAIYEPDNSVYVDEDRLSKGLCGVSRPGHFGGVLTVVLKLLNIVSPDVAVFGEKDAQQARLIERMVRDLNMSVRIELASIVREPDGLAMSSRNRHLNEAGRKRAAILYQAVCEAHRMYAEGERDAQRMKSRLEDLIQGSCVTGSDSIEYVEIVDHRSLQPCGVIDGPALVAIAVRINGTRLIDNVVLGRPQSAE